MIIFIFIWQFLDFLYYLSFLFICFFEYLRQGSILKSRHLYNQILKMKVCPITASCIKFWHYTRVFRSFVLPSEFYGCCHPCLFINSNAIKSYSCHPCFHLVLFTKKHSNVYAISLQFKCQLSILIPIETNTFNTKEKNALILTFEK